MNDTAHDELDFSNWAKGYGVIRHKPETQAWVKNILQWLSQTNPSVDTQEPFALFQAADRVASAAMWLVVHEIYACRMHLDGRPLTQQEFKASPQGHAGGSLNMVPGYVGYMLANAMTGITRSWIMGQGHTVSAIDSVNLLLDNMRPEHAGRYDWSEPGLTRYVNDFYSYRLDPSGNQDSPLGSHVNINTAGGVLEGGYLGFAELLYPHMPLPGERLVAFLSDGAFEEQRGADWAPRWWRAEDTGLITPIMIYNGRRIDERSMMNMEGGLEFFKQHLALYSFDPIPFDGTDPAAFACMILEGERRLGHQAELAMAGAINYPVNLPYGIAVAPKGAGFYGAGTNAAHNLPLGTNPRQNPLAVKNFNTAAARLFVPMHELEQARNALQNHAASGRIKEREHPMANRKVSIEQRPLLIYHAVPENRRDPLIRTHASPMDGVDNAFLATVKANPHLRPRVGNPDEMRSNRMINTLDSLKHRVAQPETGVAEAVDGKVITVLNEEAVVCACLGNKAGINVTVTYEAFSPKMMGAVRQELIWTDHLHSRNREAGWLSVPLVLTSNAYENGKNERSHQDPVMCEAMLGEPSDLSRVLFIADYNSAQAAIEACYQTHGCIYTLVIPKAESIPDLFREDEAKQLMQDGALALPWACSLTGQHQSQVILTAIGSYQLQELLKAVQRLDEKGICSLVNYMQEPGRYRDPRGRRERAYQAPADYVAQLYPPAVPHRVFISHTRPEVMSGLLHPINTGQQSIFLGYTNHGGTLDTPGMLYVNRQSWAHIVRAVARVLDMQLSDLLAADEINALEGRRNPQGVIIQAKAH